MAENSKIEWTDTTWNPLAGCTRVSPGCDNRYAAKMALRLEAMALADIKAGKDPGGKRKYVGTAVKNAHGVAMFNGVVNLDEGELQRPYTWRKPRRVFVNSMSDLFHKDVPERFILDAFNVMRENHQHIFQVLTKRPERAAEFTSRLGSFPRNIWIGTSIENQQTADERIPELLKIPATVRFLSMEPLLGPVDFRSGIWRAIGGQFCHRCGEFSWYEDDGQYCPKCSKPGFTTHSKVDWVIVGGESGPNARPMHMEWARSLRDQCVAAGVPFFFKQWGGWLPRGQNYANGEFNHPANGIMADKVGKKSAGRLLDGREWNEMPDVASPPQTD